MSDKYPTVKDEGIRRFLEEGEKLYPADAVNFTMAQQRAFYDQFCAHFDYPHPAGVTTRDFKVGDIPCRTYKVNTPKAKLLYLHGGGYVVGGIASHDSICAEIAGQAQVEVTAVEYRLAPEHPFPAAFDDCWAVLNHIGPCIVAGDSAGGNMTAALCLKSRDVNGPKITAQVLIYPGLGGDMTKGSYVEMGEAPLLSTRDVGFYHRAHLGQGGAGIEAAPLAAPDFAGLPPTVLVSADIDPLRDDCPDFRDRLAAAGVAAVWRNEPNLLHGYLRARHLSARAQASFRWICAMTRKLARGDSIAA